jgi:hypothetical protein
MGLSINTVSEGTVNTSMPPEGIGSGIVKVNVIDVVWPTIKLSTSIFTPVMVPEVKPLIVVDGWEAVS